jgi:hypothetical protein
MKKITLFSITLVLILSTVSCDKIVYPVKIITELDTTLFTDGQFAIYPWPTFEANTNTTRNILLEDYTGHKCPNCPAAATEAANIEAANPGRVFVASIHAAPGGSYTPGFQSLALDCTDPSTSFCYDFRTQEGEEYAVKFENGYDFTFNPKGNLNRVSYSGDMFFKKDFWEAKVDDMIIENNLKVNLQAKSNYYSASRGVYLHVQADFLEDLVGDYNIVTYLIENSIVEDQYDGSVHIDDYHHHNVFFGCIDNEAWGHAIGGTDPVSGTNVQTDYSYVLPTGIESDELHFLTYVYDVNTYEILQVIKHEL